MAARSNRTAWSKACSLRSLLSHACAVALGALIVLHVRLLPTLTNGCDEEAQAGVTLPSLPQRQTETKSVDQPSMTVTNSMDAASQHRHGLLPIVVIDGGPIPNDFSKLLLDATPRIRLPPTSNTTRVVSRSSVGPFYVFYPSNQQNQIQKWIQEKAPAILRDNRFAVFEPVQNTTSKRQVLLSINLWSRVYELADKALVMDQASVLCGNPTKPLLEYSEEYDWIGAAWQWAQSPTSAHHFGGNGALSIRSPTHLMQLLQLETPPPDPHPNEDMWFVRRLGEWASKGHTRNGVAAPVLAPHGIQQEFAVEEMPSPLHVTPVGVYHLMRTMDFEGRAAVLQKCPEAKTLFKPLHEPKCAVLQCPKNMSINVYDWEKLARKSKMDTCIDACNVLYHPVVNWTTAARHGE